MHSLTVFGFLVLVVWLNRSWLDVVDMTSCQARYLAYLVLGYLA
jgi:hypothetical protein